jgi:phosphomannomutase
VGSGTHSSEDVAPRQWFGTDGVEGVVGETLTAELVEAIGRAATLWSGRGRVLVGRDLGAPAPRSRRP